MSILKRLFGGGAKSDDAATATEYKGFQITPTPMAEGNSWRLCARIAREVEGARREREIIRADTFTDRADAVDASVAKARQVIDEQGLTLFD